MASQEEEEDSAPAAPHSAAAPSAPFDCDELNLRTWDSKVIDALATTSGSIRCLSLDEMPTPIQLSQMLRRQRVLCLSAQRPRTGVTLPDGERLSSAEGDWQVTRLQLNAPLLVSWA